MLHFETIDSDTLDLLKRVQRNAVFCFVHSSRSDIIFVVEGETGGITSNMTTLTLTIKDDNKTEDVLRFLRDIPFLEVGATFTKPPPTAEGPRPHFGCARDEIEMSDDFDAPLADFAEYM